MYASARLTNSSQAAVLPLPIVLLRCWVNRDLFCDAILSPAFWRSGCRLLHISSARRIIYTHKCTMARRDEQFPTGGSYRRQPEHGADDTCSEGGQVRPSPRQEVGVEGRVIHVANCRRCFRSQEPRQVSQKCRRLSRKCCRSTTATTAHPEGCVCSCRDAVVFMNRPRPTGRNS